MNCDANTSINATLRAVFRESDGGMDVSRHKPTCSNFSSDEQRRLSMVRRTHWCKLSGFWGDSRKDTPTTRESSESRRAFSSPGFRHLKAGRNLSVTVCWRVMVGARRCGVFFYDRQKTDMNGNSCCYLFRLTHLRDVHAASATTVQSLKHGLVQLEISRSRDT